MREIGYFGADAVASEAAHLWSRYSYDVFVPVSICDHQCAGMRTTLETLLAKGEEHCVLVASLNYFLLSVRSNGNNLLYEVMYHVSLESGKLEGIKLV